MGRCGTAVQLKCNGGGGWQLLLVHAAATAENHVLVAKHLNASVHQRGAEPQVYVVHCVHLCSSSSSFSLLGFGWTAHSHSNLVCNAAHHPVEGALVRLHDGSPGTHHEEQQVVDRNGDFLVAVLSAARMKHVRRRRRRKGRRQPPDPVDACNAAAHLPLCVIILSFFFFTWSICRGSLQQLLLLFVVILHVCDGCIREGCGAAAFFNQCGQCMQLLVPPVRARKHDLAAEDAFVQG